MRKARYYYNETCFPQHVLSTTTLLLALLKLIMLIQLRIPGQL